MINEVNNQNYGRVVMEKANIDIGHSRVTDETTKSAFGNDTAAVLELSTAGIQAAGNASNYSYQQMLSSLGFYSGPTDGNLNSEMSKKAIRNFQKVYGINDGGELKTETKYKINAAYNYYLKVKQTNALNDYAREQGLDSVEKENFAKTAAFLKVGLQLTPNQIAGFMGNISFESHFSTDNLRDSSLRKDHDPDYTFNGKDGVAYGLVQWAHEERKPRLQESANDMGVAITDINAQLNVIRMEMKGGSYRTAYENLKKTDNVNDAARVVFEQYEQPINDPTLNERIKQGSHIRYVLMQGWNE